MSFRHFEKKKADPGSIRSLAKAAGISARAVARRMKNGESLENALFRPPVKPTGGRLGDCSPRANGGKTELSADQKFANALRAVLGKDPLYVLLGAEDPTWDSWRGIERAS